MLFWCCRQQQSTHKVAEGICEPKAPAYHAPPHKQRAGLLSLECRQSRMPIGSDSDSDGSDFAIPAIPPFSSSSHLIKSGLIESGISIPSMISNLFETARFK